jgi:hypothetical protein
MRYVSQPDTAGVNPGTGGAGGANAVTQYNTGGLSFGGNPAGGGGGTNSNGESAGGVGTGGGGGGAGTTSNAYGSGGYTGGTGSRGGLVIKIPLGVTPASTTGGPTVRSDGTHNHYIWPGNGSITF